MKNKLIFHDSDALICFLEIDEIEFLKNMFSKVIIPEAVFVELNVNNAPVNVKNNLKDLISENFVEVREVEFASGEYVKNKCISEGYWTDGRPIGRGESAVLAFAIENEGIVASNNLSDVFEICDRYEIPILTASLMLAFAFELGIYTKSEINCIWNRILQETYQILPKQTFDEYYIELFEDDCNELLKSYDFKKHYINSKK
ncbi:hypothetical protein [Methanobrevibacter sp.]|uniref:hypothetical protein n=1 Tax=Methanobrevibacter sp. TaxID=66852 RepID=UPI00386491F6